MRRLLVRTGVIAAWILIAADTFAAGGFVVDDLLVTNNGAIVLTENFDSGSLSGWRVNNAILQQTQPQPPRYNLLLNSPETGPTTMIERDVPISNPGKLDVSAWVYLPAEEEQSNWAGTHCDYAGFVIYTSRGMPDRQEVALSLYLSPQNKGYLASARYHDYTGKTRDVLSSTDKPVLNGGKWARMSMSLDPGQRTASVFIDGKFACRITYEPRWFVTVTGIRVYSQLGGQAIKQ